MMQLNNSTLKKTRARRNPSINNEQGAAKKLNYLLCTHTLLWRTVLLLVVGIFALSSAQAQISLSLQNGSGSYNNAEEICMDMIVDDFTDFFTVGFTIEWNPDILNFERLDNLENDRLNLTIADHFDLSSVSEGLLTFRWESPTGEGVTINTRDFGDMVSIFQLCFTTSENCGGASAVNILRSTITSIRPQTPNSNIGFDEVEDAEVTVAGTPITITTGQATGNPEEIVCVPVNAESFIEMEGAQFSMRWDTSIIKFVNLEINPDFPRLNSSSFNTARSAEGVITFVWFDNTGASGTTLPEITKMFDLCFEIVSEGGEVSPILFSNDPTPIEISTVSEGFGACNILNEGRVFVNEEMGEVTIKSGSQAVKPGDDVCVDVTVSDFLGVDNLEFSIGWDPSIIEFSEITNFNLAGLDISDFDLTASNSGTIVMRWTTDNPVVFPPPDERAIFTLCFTAVGPVGSSTRVAFTDAPRPPKVGKPNNPDAGLNTRSGTISILPAESLNLNVSNATVQPAQEFCVQVQADNFTDIVNLEYSMGWETTLIEFVSVNNFGLDDLDESNFDLSGVTSGFLSVAWASETFEGETLEDGSVLYELCFRVKDNAQLGLCNAIFFNDFPSPINAITSNSNGNSIEVTDQGNDICVFQPDGFTVTLPESNIVPPGETICLPVVVSNFDSLNAVQFSVNWNPSVFQFVDLRGTGNLPDFDPLFNANSVLADLGVVSITWTTDDCVSLEDDVAIFELCLRAVGERKTRTDIEISSAPLPFDVTSCRFGSENDNLSLNPINGELEVGDALVVIGSFPIPPSCSNDSDGLIEVLVDGGTGDYEYVWDTEPIQTGPAAANLSQDTYCVTITDRNNGLTVTECFDLTADFQSPIADAGSDKNIACGDGVTILGGVNSSAGDDISYTWTRISGSSTIVPADERNPTVFGGTSGTGGVFLLQVSSDSTGCSAVDTVAVTVSDEPIANAGTDTIITCDETSITLDATEGTQAGEEISYFWTGDDGQTILNDTLLTPTMTEGGTYTLRVLHEEGCVNFDTVVITDLREDVRIDAGADQVLNCSGDPVMLTAVLNAEDSTQFTVEWFAINQMEEPVSTGFNAEVLFPDTFLVRATNNVSGCVATDTVTVAPDQELPVIAISAIDELDCRNDSTTLNIRISNVDSFSVRWLAPVPEMQANQQNPVVTEPGTYEVIVTNLESGCTTNRSDIVVTQNIEAPVANIIDPERLGCLPSSSIILDRTGSSEGDLFIYDWSSDSEDNLVLTAEDSNAEVFDVGTYYLEVTNGDNGCTAIDSVVVRRTENTPEAFILIPTPIACDAETTQLDGSLSNGSTFQWRRLEGEGAITLGILESIATVDGPGLFELVVSNAEGCTASATMRVIQASEEDVIFDVSLSEPDLTCEVLSSTLSITGQPNGADYIYTWLREGEPLSINAAEAELTEPGAYFIQVTDRTLNCTREEIVVLNQDIEINTPIISNTGSELTLDCGEEGLILDASASTKSPAEQVQWIGPNGQALPDTVLQITVQEAGVYTLIFSNSENGCVDSTSVPVETASDVLAIIEEPEVLTCTDTTILLNGFNSSTGQNISYEWSSGQGNPVQPNTTGQAAFVSAPGTYTLRVIDETSGCSSSVSVEVEANQELPTVDAGMDTDFGCEKTIVLDGSSSSTIGAADYQWQQNGQAVGNTAQIDITSPGTYTLIVTDGDNGCTNSAQVMITRAVELPTPDAGLDETTCDNSTELIADLPANTTGIWTSTGSATFEDASSAITAVTNLQAGENMLIWTLSAGDCIDYDSDTVTIFVELTPDASNDQATLVLDSKTDSLTIKVTANDNLFGINNWTADISSKPKIGSILAFTDGVVTYTARPRSNTTDQFSYLICNANCPALCDSAQVNVTIEVDDDLFEEPNTITPNGDGKNDQLIFETLRTDQDFPDNQILIYNRWGDLVFEAEPYNNDWDGTSNDGVELPQGAYYYILRLDVANGEILQGEVVILK